MERHSVSGFHSELALGLECRSILCQKLARPLCKHAIPRLGLLALGMLTGLVTAQALPVINVEHVVVGEASDFAEFVVRLSEPSDLTVSVDADPYPGTAVSEIDFVDSSWFVLSFAPGETVRTVRVPVIDDTVQEKHESFRLYLNDAVNAVIGNNMALATIVDNDAPSGLPIISISDPVVDENAVEMVFDLILSCPADLSVSVSYTTAPRSADGSDFSAGSGIVTFPPGQTAASVRVRIINDSVVEGDEQFDLVLTNPVNATVPDPRGTATVVSNDSPPVALPVIDAAHVTVGEAEAVAEFVVRLSAPSTELVSVYYDPYPGTALSGDDFYDYQGQYGGDVYYALTFVQGETVKTVRVPVLDDVAQEPDESFFLLLDGANNAYIGTGQVVATILDNDGSDSDGDGIPNVSDNCPLTVNADQKDTERDGFGNACDSDDDNDGLIDALDTYPLGFADVPIGYWAFVHIEGLAISGITAGCGNGNFCPSASVTRAQMAVFLERGINGAGFVPPPATGIVFADVPSTSFAGNFIERLAADGITAGCGNGNYCPTADVTRAQMAVFLLRAKYGANYQPPAATGVFADVAPNAFAAKFIEQLAREGITAGCGSGNYCPNLPVSRAQMAVFLVRTFGL